MRTRASSSRSASRWLDPSPPKQCADSLATMLASVMPHVSPATASVLRALARDNGNVADANSFARSLGLRNRHQLRRILRADGLPCLEDLAGWVRILGWVIDAESSGIALCERALLAGKSPEVCYRMVKRLTGKTWGDVRGLGSQWVLIHMTAGVANE